MASKPDRVRWLRHMDDRAALRLLLVLGAMALLVGVLAVRAAIYLRNSFDAVRYPFGLDYGEGIVWQQAWGASRLVETSGCGN